MKSRETKRLLLIMSGSSSVKMDFSTAFYFRVPNFWFQFVFFYYKFWILICLNENLQPLIATQTYKDSLFLRCRCLQNRTVKISLTFDEKDEQFYQTRNFVLKVPRRHKPHSCSGTGFQVNQNLTNTGENVQKWTRVFSTRRWAILVARTRRKNRERKSVSIFGRFRLYRWKLWNIIYSAVLK